MLCEQYTYCNMKLNYRCAVWIQNCRREDLLGKDPKVLNKNNALCNDHFEDSQFMNLMVSLCILKNKNCVFLKPFFNGN